MASAAFRDERIGERAGAVDPLRQLLSHSARARSQASSFASALRPARPYPAPAPEPAADAAELESEVMRLEAELRVVRAALRAEQAETAALRAELDRAASYAAPVTDIRGDRDRWATLVERLLFNER